ncbi:MAG: amino acid permease, partial [Planctomycetota bacterium]|nr:amino acid permease [Planctomycetota bacterium]
MNSQPKKQFGTWTLTFLVIANMVGAGVFTTSGFAIGELHSPAAVVAAWIVAGIIAMAGAISYGQLIRQMPESGGEYLFLSRAYHPMIGFIAGWVSMFAGFTAAIAVAALALETYVVPEQTAIPKGSVAILVVIV